MNSRQLSYFIAVAEEKNISKAAERLPLSSSALAKQIMTLENEVGVVLFTRLARGVKLTAAGEVWLQHAYQLKCMLGQAGKDVRRSTEELLGQLNVGVASAGMIGTLPKMLEIYTENHPNVQLVLHDLPTRQQQIEALQQGKILVAFNNFFPEKPHLCTEVVTQEPLWVGLSPRHPLANRPAINLTELRGHSMIGGRELVNRPRALERVFRHHDFEPEIEHRAGDVYSFLGMITCGLGVALLPPSVQALRFPGVVFRPLLADFELTTGFDCVYLKDELSPLLDALLDSVRAYRTSIH